MFAKSKSSGSTPSVLLPNPLQNLYDVGKQTATAGPENAWRIYNGYTKADRKVISQNFFIQFFRLGCEYIYFQSKTLEIYSPQLFFYHRVINVVSLLWRRTILSKVLLSKSVQYPYSLFVNINSRCNDILFFLKKRIVSVKNFVLKINSFSFILGSLDIFLRQKIGR